MLREKHPLAWTFHRNTSRWPHNMLSLPDTASPEAPCKEYYGAPLIPLPEAQPTPVTLTEAIEGRFSCRRFADTAIKQPELATLLKFAYGRRGTSYFGDYELIERPVPSGGGLYPLELYLLVRQVEGIVPGVYHYAIIPHALEQIHAIELPRRLLSDLFLGQPYAAHASMIVVMTAVVERTMWKYGDRGYRYILFEAGHVAQNLNLMATALGLGSLNLGGFFDDDLTALIGLEIEQEVPLYGVAVGPLAAVARAQLRLPDDQGFGEKSAG